MGHRFLSCLPSVQERARLGNILARPVLSQIGRSLPSKHLRFAPSLDDLRGLGRLKFDEELFVFKFNLFALNFTGLSIQTPRSFLFLEGIA